MPPQASPFIWKGSHSQKPLEDFSHLTGQQCAMGTQLQRKLGKWEHVNSAVKRGQHGCQEDIQLWHIQRPLRAECVPPPLHMLKPYPSMWLYLEWVLHEMIRIRWDYKSGNLWWDYCHFTLKLVLCISLSALWGHNEKAAMSKPGREPSASTLILDFSASKIMRNKCPPVKPPSL